MSIDSAAKRRSISGILTGVLLVGVTPDATPDAAWRRSAGWGYEGITGLPEDDDSDVSVTTRVGPNGETLRPVRPVWAHAAEGVRSADFTGFDRITYIDRHRSRSSRMGRVPNAGVRFEWQFTSGRAGDTFALQRLIAWVSATRGRQRAADATTRTGPGGESLMVPTFQFGVAAEGEREADFSTLGATVQDRWTARYAVPSSVGAGARFMVEMETDGRAGACFAFERLVAWVSATDARKRLADTTTRTGPGGESLMVPTFLASVSADGEREADRATIGATVQDRWVARFAVPSAERLGQGFHWEIETDGRAGACFALERLVAWVSDAADARREVET